MLSPEFCGILHVTSKGSRQCLHQSTIPLTSTTLPYKAPPEHSCPSELVQLGPLAARWIEDAIRSAAGPAKKAATPRECHALRRREAFFAHFFVAAWTKSAASGGTRPAVLISPLPLAHNLNFHNPLGRMPIPLFRYPPGPPLPVRGRLHRRQNLVLLIADNDVGGFFAGDGAFGVMTPGDAGNPRTVVSSCRPPLSVRTSLAVMVRCRNSR